MHLKKAVVVLCVCVFSLPNRISAQYNADKCITPDNKQGECILLPRCPPIASILQQRPISQENVEYLRKSGCGFEGLEPKVCCPLKETATTTTATPASSPTYATDGESNDLLPDTNNCGDINGNKIYGGEIADIGEFPWMALLEYQTRSGKGFYCGGVLISSKYVLTAAHCLKGKDLPSTWRLISVRLGEYNTSSAKDCQNVGGGLQCADDPVDVPIETQIAHEDYDPYDVNQYHDIALLRLSRSVQMSSYIKPICLPKGNLLTRSYEGNKMHVAGWGKTETNSTSEVILKLEIEVRKTDECQSTYKSVRVAINDGQLCAGGVRGQDSCRGDSGGPLMRMLTVGNSVNYYALGVVSFGPSPCGMQGWPGVYTRVTKYIPWIISKIKP